MQVVVLFISIYFIALSALAGESYSPTVNQSYPANVYWGDTHVHTNLSVDTAGNKHGPEDAYRFAMGESLTAHNGMEVRRSRPLDFIVIADHAFNLGVLPSLQASDPNLLKTKTGKRLYAKYKKFHPSPGEAATFGSAFNANLSIWNYKSTGVHEDEYTQYVWQQVTANADKYNNPGKFTSFIGYEWTSFGTEGPGGSEGRSNLHRVVVFKDGANKANQILPFSVFDSPNPEDLWSFFENYQQQTGGDVLAIPHNGNLSNGEMFSQLDFEGRPISQLYAKTRSQWEPLYEVTQTKGDTETHSILSPDDEFSDYETWNGWSGKSMEGIKTDGWIERKKSEYARSALKLGLEQKAKGGVNPFKFGVIGSTDSHTSMSTADESNFWGKGTTNEPSSERILMSAWGGKLLAREFSASGYAAVWAKENTRESLFAAMKRKETYATTGPRMTVRFFGGWDYQPDDALRPNLPAIGYRKGVPMGGDLTNAPSGQAPRFLIRAVKDPVGANLDRVQVIKGWHDSQSELHEKIYDVALSDNRKSNWRGKVASVGNTVDVPNASYTNAIGDPELAVVWEDPDFDKGELAFYYVRVLEIPTPRWTAYDAKFFQTKGIPEDVPMVTRERAYSSPIWYSP